MINMAVMNNIRGTFVMQRRKVAAQHNMRRPRRMTAARDRLAHQHPAKTHPTNPRPRPDSNPPPRHAPPSPPPPPAPPPPPPPLVTTPIAPPAATPTTTTPPFPTKTSGTA